VSSSARPDDRTIGAGTDRLAQVSVAARELAASQRLRSSTKLSNESRLAGSSISLDPARDRFLHSEVASAPLPLEIRSGFVLVGFTGFLLSVALTAVVVITQLGHPDEKASNRHSVVASSGGSWSGPLPLATLAMRDDLSSPYLIVQSSRVMEGEPAPLGVAVEGRAEDAVVIIKGLMVHCSRAGPQNKEPRRVLALKIEVYDPATHYQPVRDVWGGVRTPDGR
jgi:hypothetical protein